MINSVYGTLLLLSSVLVLAQPSFAQQSELSKEDQKALQQTMQMLQNEQQRNQAIQGNDKAKAADDAVNSLVQTPEQKKKLYDLASKIFKSMTENSKGDGNAINLDLDKAAQNPEGFANQLSPEQRKALRELAEDIGSKKSTP